METFDSLKAKLSKSDLQYQFQTFKKNLPKTILPSHKDKLIKKVIEELGIIETDTIASCESVDKRGDELFDLLSIKLGYSLRILCPPVSACTLCDKNLSNRAGSPIQVMVHDASGPSLHSKYSYRCKECKLVIGEEVTDEHRAAKQNVNFNANTWGNKKNGNYHYSQKPKNVSASEEVFLTEELVDYYLNLRNHAQVTYEGFSESYNETWRGSRKVELVQLFLCKHPDLKKKFDKNLKDDKDDLENLNEGESNGRVVGKSFTGFHELHRKSLARAVWRYEIQDELAERSETHNVAFGPYTNSNGNLVSFKQSVEDYLGKVLNLFLFRFTTYCDHLPPTTHHHPTQFRQLYVPY